MEQFEYEAMAQNQEKHWWFAARREILDELIKKFASQKNKKILEIGAGTGANIEMLSTHGKLTAVEPNELARKKISEKFPNKITLINGKLPSELNLENKKFDLICLFDVLEHIKDDKAALHELKKHLTTDAHIILTVPAFQFLWSEHDKNLHHFRRYNKKDLKNLIASCGLETVECGYFNSFLFPLAFLARIFDKIFPSKQKPEKIPFALLNQTLREIFAMEKIFLAKGGVFPFGLSLYAILK